MSVHGISMDKFNEFGGLWTKEKLKILRKYLSAYTMALKKQPFSLCYIDAFAGAGYCEIKQDKRDRAHSLFSELCEEEASCFLDGSAKIALEIGRPFDEYVFIEKSSKRIENLKTLSSQYPQLSNRITILKNDANARIKTICQSYNWRGKRAVVFLDPFGMQVEWETIVAIAETKAIDLWLLFPISAINRMLTSSGVIDPAWRRRLDIVFGTTEWYEEFYARSGQLTLFDMDAPKADKSADFKAISEYIVKRLEGSFAGVAKKPKTLFNSRNHPLYLFCFAVGNEKGKVPALRIANDILGSWDGVKIRH